MESKNNISSFTVIVSFLCLAIIGLALIPLLPVKLSPSQTLPSLTVSFGMSNSSARIVEMEATSKMEAMLSRMKGIKSISSSTSNGNARITISFDKHVDMDMARFEASTIIRQTWPELPEGVSFPRVSLQHSDRTASRPFMTYSVNSIATPAIIQKYAEEFIKPKLSELSDIYDIRVSGATPIEWHIVYDNDQLKSAGLTVSDIISAINMQYQNDFLGLVEDDSNKTKSEWKRMVLRTGDKDAMLDPSKIIVKNSNGTLINLNQIVKVTRQEAEPTSYFRINGLNSIYISIEANETANQLLLSKQVKEKMEEIELNMPKGYEIHNRYDASEHIEKELDKIYFRTGLTILILLLFVLLITRNIKYLFLIVITLSINLCVAAIFFYIFKLEIQLYSLAGITISLSLIIDNTIIMTDHVLHKQNRFAFMPMLAATMTTVGALSIIFFLDEKIRLNLQDFSIVVIINLIVSLFVALFLVPALVEKVKLKKRKPKKLKWVSPQRITVWLNRFYKRLITVLGRRKWIPVTAMVLFFGLPVFLIPDKINKETKFAKQYNKIVQSETYKNKVKPIVNKTLGGTLRLFTEKAKSSGGYFDDRSEQTVLRIQASMPNGTTLSQMNDLIIRMETFLSSFPEISQFQTNINSALSANISVSFHEYAEKSGFPYSLRNEVVTRATQLGGGSWGVYGLQDRGFSNDVSERAGNNIVELYGYNYDDLTMWADTLKNRFLDYRRIKKVAINSRQSWNVDDYQEFLFVLDREKLAAKGITPNQLFSSIQPEFVKNRSIGYVMINGERENIKLSAKQARTTDIWGLEQVARNVTRDKAFRLDNVSTISKEQAPKDIRKENQQYTLTLQFEYIGSAQQGQNVIKKEIEKLNEELPMGYRAENPEYSGWWWGSKDNKDHRLIFLLIVIIFFTTSILFNSIKQPLAVIFTIPISFTGVFLTFYMFNISFGQGGFASFILLAGITVNASIYILNEYNLIRKRKPNMTHIDAYVKAWNTKIIPISLTIISTILGFIPFMVGTGKDSFWFPLAAGAIGGLIMSVVGIYIFLPLTMIKVERKKRVKKTKVKEETV